MAVVSEELRNNCSSLPNACSEVSPWGLSAVYQCASIFSKAVLHFSAWLNFLATAQVFPWKHHLHYHCTVGRWQCHYVSFYETEIITKRCIVRGMGNSCFNQPNRREASSLDCF